MNYSDYSNVPGQSPQPRKRHRVRNVLLGLFGAIVLIIVLAVVTSGSHPATPAPAPVAGTVTSPAYPSTAPAASKPAATKAAVTQPAAPAADQVIARFSGTGSGNTGAFTVPADGDWHLSYAYTNGSNFAGQAENFQVYEYGTDGTLDNVVVNALAIGNGTPTAVPQYSDTDAGQRVYFQVNTEDAGWSVVVLTGSS
jgi:hypothetical protein